MSRHIALSLALGLFLAVATAPEIAAEGVRRGLSLCGAVIVPSLFPFFILSGLLTELGLPEQLSRILEKPLERVLHVPGVASAPLCLGLLGGYPMGAACVADLVRKNKLSRTDAQRLLGFCNNTGPAFLLGTAGMAVFHSQRAGLCLYLCHALAACISGILVCRVWQPQRALVPAQIETHPAPELPLSFTSSVQRATGSVVSICGFVVCFCVCTALWEHSGSLTDVTGWLHIHTGWELQLCRALCLGLLELGGGIAAMQGLPPTPGHLALASFLLGFGGLSVHAQTMAVVHDAALQMRTHTITRLLHACLSAALAYALSPLLLR